MTDEIQAEIQVQEGVLTLNGPRVHPDGSGNVYVWATKVRGQVFLTAFIVALGDDETSETYKRGCAESKEDLEYTVKYVTTGCGEGDNPQLHRFMGDPEDTASVLLCLDCNVVKKRGVSLPGLVDMRGRASR